MTTILFGLKTYSLGDPTAARLMREAVRLRKAGRGRLARGLVALALKVEDGTLSAAEATELEGPVRHVA